MNTHKKIKVPGKIMLSGEYAVLFGERALAFTVDSYLEVQASVSEEGCFHIDSDFWKDTFRFKSFDELPSYKRNFPLILALKRAQEVFNNPPLHRSHEHWDLHRV